MTEGTPEQRVTPLEIDYVHDHGDGTYSIDTPATLTEDDLIQFANKILAQISDDGRGDR